MAKTLLSVKCPYCGKTAHEQQRVTLDKEIWITLGCGHTITKKAVDSLDVTIRSKDGRTPFGYQLSPTGKFTTADGVEHMDSVHFLEESDCNGLCLHEQGLGKTVIECILLLRNKDLLPALLVVKSGLRAQWFAEVLRWTGMIAQVITSSKELPLFDMFDIVIVSVDTLRLLRPEQMTEEEKIRHPRKKQPKIIWTDEICAKFKHIAVDESQKIKNDGSSRTKALRTIAKLANDGKKARVICYSGTNIEKHAGEYFVTLNLVRPEIFPIKAHYLLMHCRVSMDGKIQGLRNPQRFRDLTKDFIIRYKREEVLPDLPKVFRQFRSAELEGSELQAYIKVVKEFQRDSEDPEVNMSQTDILGYLSRMRHITGIAKVPAAIEFLEEFLLESERKIVIFLHHKEAAAILLAKIAKLCQTGDASLANADDSDPLGSSKLAAPIFNPPLYLPGGLKLGEGSNIIEEFRKPGNRILVASSLAAGEGYNMQFCSDCLFMERQWNPSAEEQCEGRFPRPRPEDPWPVGFKINAHYLIAAGTIDDFLTDIVEQKRANVANTLDGEDIVWDETSLHSQLAKVLREKGLMKWGLR